MTHSGVVTDSIRSEGPFLTQPRRQPWETRTDDFKNLEGGFDAIPPRWGSSNVQSHTAYAHEEISSDLALLVPCITGVLYVPDVRCDDDTCSQAISDDRPVSLLRQLRRANSST